MAPLTIPTIFTAVDRISAVVSAMGKNVNTFASKAASNVGKFSNKLNSLIPGYNAVKKALLGYIGAAVLASALIGGLVFSGKSLIEYEKNVSSLHGILNNLTDAGFKPFQKEIDRVAKSTRYSAVDVAASFSKIAELNIALASTPESLGAVSSAAIVLSRASRMELTPATEALVSIMAQFGLQGKDANRVINVLSAGMIKGSSSIENQVEAYRMFGVVARGANITLEQSNALIQVLAKRQLKGSDAGTALRNAIINLQKAGAGYKSGQFSVNDALDQAKKKYDSLATARQKDAFLLALFQKRGITAGRILLDNIANYKQLTQDITGTSEAQAQSARNTDNVAGAWSQLVAQFVNYITSSDDVREGMTKLKDAIRWVTDNLDDIISGVITFVKWFTIVKTILWVVRGALLAYNLINTIFTATTIAATTATAAQTVTVTGFGAALSTTTTELELANTAASGFFATLSAFVLPAALVGLTGFAWSKIFATDHQREASRYLQDLNSAKTSAFYDQEMKPNGIQDPVAFGDMYDAQHNNVAGQYRRKMPNFIDFRHHIGVVQSAVRDQTQQNVPTLMNPVFKSHEVNEQNTHNTLEVLLKDPGHNIKSTKVNGPIAIPVTVTSTTDKK